MANKWYTEIWAPDGNRAKHHQSYPDCDTVLNAIAIFKSNNPGNDRFRVLAPPSATNDEIQKLRDSGAVLSN